MTKKNRDLRRSYLPKVKTGIPGLDEITQGGLPQGRPTLVTGAAGCGKTILAMEFLNHGIEKYDEPGVFITFEETEQELIDNIASFGFDAKQQIANKKLFIDYVHIDRSEIEETGKYDLSGLFVRINNAIEIVGAKRIVLDTLEALFTGFSDKNLLRAELRRLFRWLKEKNVTAIITGEKGDNHLTRHGLKEYISDCVINLSHHESDNVFTRRLRIVKYRGSKHETNDFPFIIEDDGISVSPITSTKLNYQVSTERISSGIAKLDEMLGGKGFYRGSSILVTGTAGTGKSSLCGHMAEAACLRGEKVLHISFEESSYQMIRNMASIGIDLQKMIDKGLLFMYAERVSMSGLEAHLTKMHKLVRAHNPSVIIIDPINSYLTEENVYEAKSMLIRMIDFIKSKNITGFFTSLTSAASVEETTNINISSLMDSWLLLRDIESNGERNRGLFVIKSRGMANSNQIREFEMTSQGVHLKDVYIGNSGILTGSSRIIQELNDKEELEELQLKIESLQQELKRKKQATEALIDLAKIQNLSDETELKDKLMNMKRQLKQKNFEKTVIKESRINQGTK